MGVALSTYRDSQGNYFTCALNKNTNILGGLIDNLKSVRHLEIIILYRISEVLELKLQKILIINI